MSDVAAPALNAKRPAGQRRLVTYDEVCRLLEPGIRSVWANDPRRMEGELRMMRLAALEYDMVVGKKPLPPGMVAPWLPPIQPKPRQKWWRLWMT